MLSHIAAILFPLFAISATGYITCLRGKPDLSVANRLNVDVFTPALVFGAMADGSFHLRGYALFGAAVFLLIALCGLAGWGIARLLRMDPKTLVPVLMYNNCGNLGLPVAVLAFGPQALGAAMVGLLVSNLVQFSFGVWLLDGKAGMAGVVRSPFMLAAAAGLVFSLSGAQVWPPLLTSVKMLGDISIPLMLFALGSRLAESRINAVGIGLLGATLRPVLGMALGWALGRALGLPPAFQAQLLVFGALPPAVLNYILAERYNQEPDKVASMVLTGNMAALVFLPIALMLALR